MSRHSSPLLLVISLFALSIFHVYQCYSAISNVSFPSKGARGGSLMIHGTLYQPGVHTLTAAVLIHGSGPQNRDEFVQQTLWNTDSKPTGSIKPTCGVTQQSIPFFKQLANVLLSLDIAVVTYDKRDCCTQEICQQCVPVGGHFPKTCYYACNATDTPQQINLKNESLADIAVDAAGAMLFLQRQGYKNLIVIGHSEGVNVAPVAINYYLNSTTSSMSITHMILLGGNLREMDYLLLSQWHRIHNRARELETACEKDPSAPGAAQLIQAMQNIEKNMEALIPLAKDFFEKFRQGLYPEDHVYYLGFAITGTYLKSMIQYSSVEFFEQNLRDRRLDKTRVMSINSPTDLNVQPEDYEPLIKVLNKRAIQLQAMTKVNVIPNLTHFMTNASLTDSPYPVIMHEVIYEIKQFLSDGQDNR